MIAVGVKILFERSILFFVWRINTLEQCLEQLEQSGTTFKSLIFEKWDATSKNRFFQFSAKIFIIKI